jgi:hypothetical protein
MIVTKSTSVVQPSDFYQKVMKALLFTTKFYQPAIGTSLQTGSSGLIVSSSLLTVPNSSVLISPTEASTTAALPTPSSLPSVELLPKAHLSNTFHFSPTSFEGLCGSTSYSPRDSMSVSSSSTRKSLAISPTRRSFLKPAALECSTSTKRLVSLL